MRLTAHEVAAIRTTAVAVFGPDAVVRLFGSRIDDARRGGDIDLHVEVPVGDGASDLEDLRFRFVDALHGAIGEQRIDVVVRTMDAAVRPIDAIAYEQGVRL
jgi:AcrR family transcriptional regulator